MLTEKSKPDKISLGYLGFFGSGKETVLRYSKNQTYLTLAIIIVIIFLCSWPAYAGWSTPRRISDPGTGYYPQIIAQGDTLHALYENLRGYDKICYLRSSDGGQTWSSPWVQLDSVEITFPRIIASGDNIIALWNKGLSGYYRFAIAYSVSSDNGLSWSIARNIPNSPSPQNLYFAASGGTGLTVNVLSRTFVNDTLIFFSIKSTNFGQNWSVPQEIFRASQSGVPDQASLGSIINFVWDGRFDLAQQWEIRCIKSTDEGLSWAPNNVLSDSDQYHSEMPAITANNAFVGCIWMDYKYSPYLDWGDILMKKSNNEGSDWSDEIQITFNHRADLSDIAAMGDTIFIAWEDSRPENGDQSIYAVRSTDGGISWEEPYWVDANPYGSWNPSIACSNGKAYLIWYDRQWPDSSGLYFSRFNLEPDAVKNEDYNLPDKISLVAYPNPFNSSVNINYSSKKGGEIKIYNTSGQFIRSLKVAAAEDGKATWDGTDSNGKRAVSGTYIMKFLSEGLSKTVKLIYLK